VHVSLFKGDGKLGLDLDGRSRMKEGCEGTPDRSKQRQHCSQAASKLSIKFRFGWETAGCLHS